MPTNSRLSKKHPDIPNNLTLPFYYSYLNNIEVFYLIPKERVNPYLHNTSLIPVLFDDKALISYNFQLYLGQFSAGKNIQVENWLSTGANITQELELNIIVVPDRTKHELNFKQFILGEEQTKLIGNYRLFVPCDADIAIEVGKTLFGEPKFKTTFKLNLPSFNPVRKQSAHYETEWVNKWGFQVNDPDYPEVTILTCIIDVAELTAVPANPSPITQYGVYQKKMIACRWNILQPMSTYFLKEESEKVQFSLGTSSHPMKAALQNLIGDTPARAVRTFSSSPVAIQSRAYYI